MLAYGMALMQIIYSIMRMQALNLYATVYYVCLLRTKFKMTPIYMKYNGREEKVKQYRLDGNEWICNWSGNDWATYIKTK